MKKFTMFAALALAMVFALSSFAGQLPPKTIGNSTLFGGNANYAKALGDTIQLMGPTGSGAPYIGDFEAGFNGFTHFDYTQPNVNYWSVSDYNQQYRPGNHAAWCGDITIASCGVNDSIGGYANSWNQLMSYRVTVADPGINADVTVAARLQNDTEPAFDFTNLSVKLEGQLGYTDFASYDDKVTLDTSDTYTYLPNQFVDGTDVYVVWRVTSDSGWSDGDCDWVTRGACQVDDVTVTVAQVGQADIVYTEDFEGGDLGQWFQDFPAGFGDFTALWSGLLDNDPCASNFSQQVAFIDDGSILPTGGEQCVNWCYGPGGYIVNTSGGLAGPGAGIGITVESPVMAWPTEGYNGAQYLFDVYRHEDLSADSPGILYAWAVRSANADSNLVSAAAYKDRGFIYYGGPDYIRVGGDVTDLMTAGRDSVQVKFELVQVFDGPDGYPAPYYDNVSFKVYPFIGPGITTREIDLAQDAFPASGLITPGDLGAMSCRFDMAKNIALVAHARNDAGDSIVLDIVPVRTGSELNGDPTLHYVIDPNPLFAGVRVEATSGIVPGTPAIGVSGSPDPTAWAFDLPDQGLLYPGDVMHYFIEASDIIGTDAGTIQFSYAPADTTGFNDFSSPMSYNSTYTVRGLPSLADDGAGGLKQPGILFWNDFGTRGGENEWYSSFANLGLVSGTDYDTYMTNGPSSGVGNGLGRTTDLVLAGYDDLLYTAGNLGAYTINNGDFDQDSDPGNDIQVLQAWLSAGNKDMYMTGDDLVYDLFVNQGPDATPIIEDVMGLGITTRNVGAQIGSQVAPVVLPLAGNPVFLTTSQWIAYGGCFGINTFDGVAPLTGATQLAEFAAADGTPGGFTYSAATLKINGTNRTITMPYDFMFIYTDPNAPAPAKIDAPLAVRVQVLGEVLDYFGASFNPGAATGVTPTAKFAVNNYPNPFNPATKIAYTIKRAGHMTLKVFNVRGELVKTLIDGNVDSSGFVMWDGTNNQGSNVSSGVYFYEARMGSDVQVNKMALVK